MSLTAAAGRAVERAPIPDVITQIGIGYLVARARRSLESEPDHVEAAFALDMRDHSIAENTDAANSQHYELPAEFFRLVLGPRRKYSSCLYDGGVSSLAQAEERALSETCAHASLADGQDVLELGCGWGSLSLWMAERYPLSRILSVSNSEAQRAFIEAEAAQRGLRNVQVLTRDINTFATERRFDRIVSVEMFEHLRN